MAASDPITVLFSGADMVLDAAGPDPVVVQIADALHVDVSDQALVLQFAAVGMPGRDGAAGAGAPIETVAAVTMVAGTPVAIDRTTGQLVGADASFKPKAFVVGLLAGDVAQGFAGSVETDRLALTDWSAIVGAAQLVPGLPYFLADGGGLTAIPPASSCVALVGRAVSATTLLIDPQSPIER